MCAAALVLALMGFGTPVRAETTIQKVPPCAPVYGTWRTAHIMDKFGNPQPLAPSPGWEGLIMEARIDKDKAVLVWFGGKKKMTFKRWDRFTQDEFNFGGMSKYGGYTEISTQYYADEDYPKDKCYINILYEAKYRDIFNKMNHDILMEKIE
ncbi:hypothetical protein [Magnetospirillum sp. UT-4]|uniref:hypothetical protein n=1 Tax=Magnetospirillum sp. UT-4 TaxID=2681467 RepID=UPI001384F503|nr:hypothetical protein [Magnetospirillum sp. UT-4]CAA7617626.1 conserved exported hypothetical protein [Magnetospirillum sp. UT-4]